MFGGKSLILLLIISGMAAGSYKPNLHGPFLFVQIICFKYSSNVLRFPLGEGPFKLPKVSSVRWQS